MKFELKIQELLQSFESRYLDDLDAQELLLILKSTMQREEKLRSALGNLVIAKELKESEGKTEHYESIKKMAWAAAYGALKGSWPLQASQSEYPVMEVKE